MNNKQVPFFNLVFIFSIFILAPSQYSFISPVIAQARKDKKSPKVLDSPEFDVTKTEPRVLQLDSTPDGRYFLYSGKGRTIRIWDRKSRSVSQTLYARTDNVKGITTGPGGNKIYALVGTPGRMDLIQIWEISTGKLIKTGKIQRISQDLLRISPNGKYLVTTINRGAVIYLNKNDFSEERRYSYTKSTLTDLAFSNDGKYLVTTHYNGHVVIWSVKKQVKIAELQAHKGHAYDVEIPKQSDVFITGGSDNLIKIWDLKTEKQVRNLSGHNGAVKSLTVTEDGSKLISWSKDKTLKTWDLSNGKNLKSKRVSGKVIKMIVVPGEKKLVCGFRSYNSRAGLQIFGTKNLNHQDSISKGSSLISDVVVDSGGEFVALLYREQAIQLFNIKNRAISKKFRPAGSNESTIAFSRDGKYLGCHLGEKIIVWNVKSGQKIFSVSGGSPPPRESYAFAFGQNKNIIFCETGRGYISRFNINSGKRTIRKKVTKYDVADITTTKKGNVIALCGEGQLQLRSGSDLSRIKTARWGKRATEIIPDPSNPRVFVDYVRIRIFDYNKKKFIKSLGRSHGTVSISSDGKLISIPGEKKIYIKNINTAKTEKIIPYRGFHAEGTAFIPGTPFLMGWNGQNVRFWKLD